MHDVDLHDVDPLDAAQHLRELDALINELAVATDPVRRDELIAELRAAGVTVNATPKVVDPDDQVPKGCVRGGDGIIRSTPGTFERFYRREVMRRGQLDARYRAEGLALLRLAGSPRVHVPSRRLEERRPSGRRPRSRGRARAPGRLDEPEPPPLARGRA